jgi:arylsulfatase
MKMLSARNLGALLLAAALPGPVLAQQGASAVTAQAGSQRPNIVIILADDLGFSDMGAFGSEIRTPNMDSLAKEGMRFTNFYTHASCSPTRSMLLTGVDTHRNGLGNMDEWIAPNQAGKPG